MVKLLFYVSLVLHHEKRYSVELCIVNGANWQLLIMTRMIIIGVLKVVIAIMKVPTYTSLQHEEVKVGPLRFRRTFSVILINNRLLALHHPPFLQV